MTNGPRDPPPLRCALRYLRRELLEHHNVAGVLRAAVDLVGPTLGADRVVVYDVRISAQRAEPLSEWQGMQGRRDATPERLRFSHLSAVAREIAALEEALDSGQSGVNPLLARASRGVLLHETLAIRRLLWVPFRKHPDGFWMMAVELIREDRSWTAEQLWFAESVVDQLSLALARLDALAELRGSEEQSHLLFDESPLMHFLVDRDGITRAVNRSALEELRYDASDLLGESVLRVVHPGDHDQITRELAICFAVPNEVRRMSFRKVRKDGSMIWVKDVARVLNRPEGPMLFFACENLTELRAQEEATRSAENKSDQKDEFMAVLGHELRNPLTPIVTALDLLRLRGLTGPELDTIDRQVAHLRRLVDDLLDISRITRGKVELHKQRQELSEIAARAVEMVAPKYQGRQQRLTVAVPTHGLPVDADPGRLLQVFSNLLTNASKFSGAGTEVVFSAQRRADRVVVEVRDQGEGIDPAMLDQVFDPFMQRPQASDRSRSGLGLGLSIVRNLVELHGGLVRARSDGLGKGASFEVELPIAQGPLQIDNERRDMLTMEPHPSGGRVLVVDDNCDAREMFCLVMTKLGYQAYGTDDGPAALATAAAVSPDVALVDIGLPGMDGYQVARELRRSLGTRVKLVAVTGYGQQSDRDRAYQAGFDVHLTKPVALETLRKLMRDHLAQAKESPMPDP